MNCPGEPRLACYSEAHNFGQVHSAGHNFEEHPVAGHSLAVRPAVVSILVELPVEAELALLLHPLQKMAAEPDLIRRLQRRSSSDAKWIQRFPSSK